MKLSWLEARVNSALGLHEKKTHNSYKKLDLLSAAGGAKYPPGTSVLGQNRTGAMEGGLVLCDLCAGTRQHAALLVSARQLCLECAACPVLLGALPGPP